MKTILGQFKKEAKSILSDLGLGLRSGSVIGLDMGLKHFRAARVREGVEELPLKDTAIKGIHELKNLAAQMAISPDERISINFTNGELLIKRLSIPFMPIEEIEEALKWELREEFHSNIDKARIKFNILGHKETESDVKKIELIAVVYKEEAVEAEVKRLKALGLNVQSVIPTEFALTAYINYSKLIATKEPVAIADIGTLATTISIVEDGRLSFTRKVNMGGEAITEAMTDTLVSDKGKLQLSKEEAEKIKCEKGISEDLSILSMMRPVLEKFVTQIKASLDYWEHEFKSSAVTKIVLAGNGAKLKGFKEYVSREIGVDVLDVLPEFTVAFGLALACSSPINMLPEKFKEEKGGTIKKISLRMILVTLGFMFLFSYGLLTAKSINLKKEIQIYRTHLETVQDIRSIRDKMVVLGSAINTVSSGMIKPGSIMKELSNIVLPSVMLEDLVIKDSEPNIELSGIILKEEQLSEFMSSLESSPIFEKVQLIFSEKNKDYSTGVLDFEIACNLTR